MMSAFGMLESLSSSSSVEALAFNYLRYGLLVLLNNLWTLVALLTAAVSFWRFNLLPSLARRHYLLKPSSSSSSSVGILAESQPQLPIIPRPVINSDQSISVTPLPMEQSSNFATVVKGNRVYLRLCGGDDLIFNHRDDDDDDEAEEEEIRLVRMRRIQKEDQTLRFDVMKRLTLSDLGFYNYQDMRVLDGNVVKLWDNTSRDQRGDMVRFDQTA